MRGFIRDKRGIVPSLIAMIVLCLVTAMIWIATMPSVGLVWDIVSPNLPSQATGPMNMLNNACGWFLLIMVVGTLIYGAACASKRDPVEYPM